MLKQKGSLTAYKSGNIRFQLKYFRMEFGQLESMQYYFYKAALDILMAFF